MSHLKMRHLTDSGMTAVLPAVNFVYSPRSDARFWPPQVNIIDECETRVHGTRSDPFLTGADRASSPAAAMCGHSYAGESHLVNFLNVSQVCCPVQFQPPTTSTRGTTKYAKMFSLASDVTALSHPLVSGLLWMVPMEALFRRPFI